MFCRMLLLMGWAQRSSVCGCLGPVGTGFPEPQEGSLVWANNWCLEEAFEQVSGLLALSNLKMDRCD